MINRLTFQGNIGYKTLIKREDFNILNLGVINNISKDKKTFVELVAYRHNADFIEKYFSVGDSILIEAKVVNTDYEAKGKRYNFVVEHVHFVGARKKDVEIVEENDYEFVE